MLVCVGVRSMKHENVMVDRDIMTLPAGMFSHSRQRCAHDALSSTGAPGIKSAPASLAAMLCGLCLCTGGRPLKLSVNVKVNVKFNVKMCNINAKAKHGPQ